MVSGEGRKLYADDGDEFSCLSEVPAVVFLTRGRDMMGGLSGQSSSGEWSSLAVDAALPTGLNTWTQQTIKIQSNRSLWSQVLSLMIIPCAFSARTYSNRITLEGYFCKNFGLVLLTMLVASNKTGKKDKSEETETVSEWVGNKMFKTINPPLENILYENSSKVTGVGLLF